VTRPPGSRSNPEAEALAAEHDSDWLPPPPAAQMIGADPALLLRLVH
jgi:hypothetical protein